MEKICVIGGGISGVSTAYYLQQSGHDVVLLESKDSLGAGATSIASPVLRKYQSPVIDYPIYEKIKSKFCPVRMFSKSVKLGDTYTHKAFKTAYGYDILKLAFNPFQISRNTEKLTALSAANYSATMDLIRKEKLDIPMAYGYLQIGDDKNRMKQLRASMKRIKMVLHDGDVIDLAKDEPSRYFPAVQQHKIDLHGGFYDPTAVVFQPSDFVEALANRIREANASATSQSTHSPTPHPDAHHERHGTVDFRLGTRALGFTLDANNKIVSVETADEQSIPVDRVVLCNGYAAFQITEDLVDEGPLLHIIPLRSFGYDVLDRTRARDSYTVPSLFPTYPLTFFPEDPIYNELQQQYEREEQERKEKLAQGIYVPDPRKPPMGMVSTAGPEIPPVDQEEIIGINEKLNLGPVAAVEFLRVGTVLAADPSNPRHIYGYAGKDMAELSGEVDDLHIQGILAVLEAIRKVPMGAISDPYFLDPENLSELTDELRKRYELETKREEERKGDGGLSRILPFNRPGEKRLAIDREPVASRHLSMQPRAISLHTVGRDGLPMIGYTHKIPNLLVNTGHGAAPQNTAVIGSKIIADLIHSESAQSPSTTNPISIDTQLHGLTSSDIIRYADYSPQRFDLKPFKTAWFEQSLATRKAAAERKAQEAMLRKHLKLQQLKKQAESGAASANPTDAETTQSM